jgi:hypothetical protein
MKNEKKRKFRNVKEVEVVTKKGKGRKSGKRKMPQKRKRMNPKRRPAHNRGQLATRGTTRSILNGSLPKTYFNVKGSATGAVASGCEVVAKFNTSSSVTTFSMPLNPKIAQLFPKLSAYAGIWERFRFEDVRVTYHTGAPATRSGSIGIAVHTDIISTGDVPTDAVAFANWQYSRVGSIAESISSPNWRNKDPEFFFMSNPTGAALDPLKVFQGSVCAYIADSSTGDADLLAGYFSIEYVCRFQNARPAPQISAIWSGSTEVEVKQSNAVVPVSTISSNFYQDDNGYIAPTVNSGRWDTKDAKSATGNFFSSAAQVADGIQKGYAWISDAIGFLGVGVTPAEAKVDKQKRGVKGRVAMPLEATLTWFYNPAKCEGHEGWIPLEDGDAEIDEKTGQMRGIARWMVPAVAVTGDITCTWYTFDGTDATPVANAAVVAAGIGTGSYTVQLAPTRFLLGGNSSFVAATVCPFAGDVRYAVAHDQALVSEGSI